MQIYEITKKPRVDEVLGTMAAGVGKALANKFISSQLPGVSLYGDDDDTAAKPAARQTPPPPPPSYKPPTPNFGQQQAAAQPTTAPTWQGANINVPAVQRKQAAQPAAAPAAAPTPSPAAAPTPSPSVTPRPGYRIAVQLPAGGKYYKTDKGWTNEVGQAIIKPASIATLEKRADAAGREERITKPQPAPLPGKPMRTRRKR